MPRPLVIDTLVDLVPLAPKLGATEDVPAALQDALLGDLGDADGQTRLYTVIDAAQVNGLQAMLENQQLPAKCLYTGDALETHSELAPWLVELAPGDRLLRALMTASDSPETDAGWHLWRNQVGIFIRSDAPLETLWQHFRKYTMASDEAGARFFLRFFEPDFLAPMLGQAEPGEIAGFFRNITRIVAIEQPKPERWQASLLSADPTLDAAPTPLVLTRRKWRALQLVEFNRRAHAIFLARGMAPEEQRPFVDTAVRLQTYGFDNESNLVDTFETLKQIDPAHHGEVWRLVASGEYSIGFLLFQVRRQFGIEDRRLA